MSVYSSSGLRRLKFKMLTDDEELLEVSLMLGWKLKKAMQLWSSDKGMFDTPVPSPVYHL